MNQTPRIQIYPKPKKKSILKKIFIIILIIIFLLINSIGFYFGYLTYCKACRGLTSKGITNMYDRCKYSFDEKRFKKLSKEEVSIKSKYGYKLNGTYILNPRKTKNTVVIVHGILGSRWESMKYADIYLDKGFNVLIYDSRYHGTSGGDDVTFGYCEKYDLDRCIDWIEKKNPNGIIGAHGESLGGATVLLHSKLNLSTNRVKFYVSDCSYSDLEDLLVLIFKRNLHISNKEFYNKCLAKTLIFYSSACALINSKFTYSNISPEKAIKHVKTPIMFVHGSEDSFIPKQMSEEMYKIKPGYKKIYIAPNSGHAQSYLRNKKEYEKSIYEFIDQYVDMKN